MSIKEQIAKAAVKYHYLGETEQRVVAFAKHQECYTHLMCEQISVRKPIKVDSECYLTNTGRYVDRREARDIAYTAGQLPKSYQYDILYPNDEIKMV